MTDTKNERAEKPLTRTERTALANAEKILAASAKSYLSVGQALRSINELRLYRETHKTFPEYTVDRWEMSDKYAYRLINSSDFILGISTIVESSHIRNGTQAFYLSEIARKYGEARAIQVLGMALREAGDKPLNGAHIQGCAGDLEKRDEAAKEAAKQPPAPRKGKSVTAARHPAPPASSRAARVSAKQREGTPEGPPILRSVPDLDEFDVTSEVAEVTSEVADWGGLFRDAVTFLSTRVTSENWLSDLPTEDDALESERIAFSAIALGAVTRARAIVEIQASRREGTA